MKTIATGAMEAIEAGEAIVTGAVEIIPVAAAATWAVLDTGTTIDLGWWQNTFVQTGGNDEARMGIGFLDQYAASLGSITWSTFTQPTSWTSRSLSVASPAGAAIVRVYMEMRRKAGTHNDGYIDDIELTIGGAPVALANPGAESGTAGWTVETGGLGAWNASLGAAGTPAPHAGSYYFSGANFASSRSYQNIGTLDDPGDPGPPIRLWGGYGPITIDGNEYQGIGARGLAQQSGGAIGGVAQGITLNLSGIEPAALTLLDAAEIKGAAAVVYRLIFASDGKTLLDAHVFDRGRVDAVATDEMVGGEAGITVAVESAARGLGRSGGRMRADSDQRLIDPTDGYFKETAYAGQKTLYWGGKRPAVLGS